jgi:hypothetical protein
VSRGLPSRTRSSGFTLVEGLIVCTLLLGMMGLVAAFFDRGQRYTVETNSYATVQRDANEILRKVTHDLYQATSEQSRTGPSSVMFLSYGPTAAGDPPIEMENPSGRILWRKWIAYYLDIPSETLYRTEVPLDAPTSTLMSSPQPDIDNSYIRGEPGLERRPCGQGVSAFVVVHSGRKFKISLTTVGAANLTGLDETQRKIEVTVSTEITVLE